MHRPLLVDLTVEEGTRLKVIYGSADGFHAVDLDSASVYDIYIPKHVSVLIPLYFYLSGAVGFWPIVSK
jgi:misshapen/NIK-related kinase